jgi:hypothetical protein
MHIHVLCLANVFADKEHMINNRQKGWGDEKGGKGAYRGVKGHRDENRGGVTEKRLREGDKDQHDRSFDLSQSQIADGIIV